MCRHGGVDVIVCVVMVVLSSLFGASLHCVCRHGGHGGVDVIVCRNRGVNVIACVSVDNVVLNHCSFCHGDVGVIVWSWWCQRYCVCLHDRANAIVCVVIVVCQRHCVCRHGNVNVIVCGVMVVSTSLCVSS